MRLGHQIVSLFIWIGICFIPAVIGSRFSPGDWYARLAKPSWTPPGFIFGPVWTLLYTTMGIAAWLLWKRVEFSAARVAFMLFIVQLIFNGMWSWIFFGLHKPGFAFVELCFLWALILATLIMFWNLYRPSGILLVPYLAWVTFAAILNFAIWWLN
ncbi:MAG: tryptophan-rich sensory protein [Candidatus Zixiibacteriota bacterium]|nr:MAG: tryptophan-rich sensory protein [candidate division Zixibacteria bacterium]